MVSARGVHEAPTVLLAYTVYWVGTMACTAVPDTVQLDELRLSPDGSAGTMRQTPAR